MSQPAGELSFATAVPLLEQLDASAGTLDLAQVTRADSAGIALLLELTRRARARKAELAIVNANEQVRSLAKFFGVDSLLEFR